MKRAAFLLLLFVSVASFGQFRSTNQTPLPLIDIVGSDSTYFWKNFKNANDVLMVVDFTDFSTDLVKITPFYIVVDEETGKEVPVNVNTSVFPLTLVKATYQKIVNGDTSHTFAATFDTYMADRLALKVEQGACNDTLKVYFRK